MRLFFPLSASPRLRSVGAQSCCALFCALLVGTTLPAASSAEPTPALHALTYSGDQAALTALDRELQSAGKDPAKLATVEKQILTALARRDATFAARQALAQRLALVLTAAPDPKSPAHKTLTALLADPRDSDLSRLALQPVPGAAIDTLFVNALANSTDNARLGLLDAIATRRIAAAVAPLTPLLRDADAATARAAARALGEIGTTAALTALRAAPLELTASARLAAASRLPAREALAELRDLQNNTAVPHAIRDAAFRTALDLDLPNAAHQIAAGLASSDLSRRQVAAEAIATSRAPNLVATLAGKLPSFDAPTQAAVLSAFARRGEAAAVPAVLQTITHRAPEPRAAAIAALGFLPGTPEIANTLAKLAATSDRVEDTKLAKQSLARLNGPGVSAAIMTGAERADTALRPVFLEQLALRNQTEALPILFQARHDPAPAIRLAAVAAVGEIAPLSAQPALLEWTLTATDEAVQARALRSLVNVILRDPADATRGQVLFDAIDKANSAVAQRLLPALARIGGTRAADTAARLATRDDPQLATPATTALTRWTDSTALGALATVAEKAAQPATRETARAGVLRYFERNRDPWTPEFTSVVSRLLATATDTAERKKLIALLHRASDDAALDLAQSLASNPDATLAAAAKTAADVVRANQLGAPVLRASGATSSLKNMLDRKTSTRWNVPTEGEEWLEIDFRTARPLHTITLDQTTRAAEFPERYEVHLTDDPKNPGPVVLSGKGQQTKTILEFPANTRARYVLIKNVAERKDSQWSIVELYVD